MDQPPVRPAEEPEHDAIAVVTVLIGQPPRVRIRYARPNARWIEHVHAAPEPAMAELWAWCEAAFRLGEISRPQ
ncbi:hypothetical protein [Pseudactinotalea terrae]|uniref:hypothetical protein n=1 Tax=Pseudactinotalea terrae TaxID=1743262 RepID=UPI0012E1A7DB|nr:hypothetical protein [Pseudactinotalea terrae]